jgi:CBS domain-containing protein
MKVHDVMVKEPVYCTPSDDIALVAAALNDYKTSIMPVTEHHRLPSKLLGVITPWDICTKVVANAKDPYTVNAGECMSREITACEPGDSIDVALLIMRDAGRLRLPVANHKGELIGTISMGDIIRHQGTDSRKLFEILAVICMNDGAPEQMPTAMRV